MDRESDITLEERAYAILRKVKGLSAEDALTLLVLIREMAAANLIHRFESKLDAQNSKFTLLLWMFGTLIALFAVLTASNFIN